MCLDVNVLTVVHISTRELFELYCKCKKYYTVKIQKKLGSVFFVF